jgi:hypothetical protein
MAHLVVVGLINSTKRLKPKKKNKESAAFGYMKFKEYLLKMGMEWLLLMK